jgi:predicted dehydrogenase
MATFRWGIFGTGAVSVKFTADLRHAQDAEASFVASRTLAKAEQFAASLGVNAAISGYSEGAATGGVDAVYIATPPALHKSHALTCIEAGIPVLVEKPFACSAADTRQIADAARANGVFAMEALWTRFLPAAAALKSLVDLGALGEVHAIAGSFGTSQQADPANGMFDAGLGGGAVSHLAPYPLSWGQWLFGEPQSVDAIGVAGPTGVDEEVAIHVRYPRDVIGSFFVSLRTWARDDLQVLGSAGMAAVRGTIVRPHGLKIMHEEPLRSAGESRFNLKERLRQNHWVHQIAQRADRSSRGVGKSRLRPYAGNGYHYEADEVRACIESGAIESSTMPLNDSIAMAETADIVRNAIQSGIAHLGGTS